MHQIMQRTQQKRTTYRKKIATGKAHRSPKQKDAKKEEAQQRRTPTQQHQTTGQNLPTASIKKQGQKMSDDLWLGDLYFEPK